MNSFSDYGPLHGIPILDRSANNIFKDTGAMDIIRLLLLLQTISARPCTSHVLGDKLLGFSLYVYPKLLLKIRFNPSTAGVAYIRVFIFINTLSTTF